jgi:SulP family sulfate permease
VGSSKTLTSTKFFKGNNVYEVHGTLFFASKEHFQELFDPKADTNDVYIDFGNARVLDHSAIQAIDKLAIRYKRIGKTLHLQHLSAECRLLLKTAKNLVEVNVLEDPTYHVADDKLPLSF